MLADPPKSLRARAIRHAVRMIAWACVLALAILSLLPADEIVRTGMGGQIEHVVAYAATGALLTWSYRNVGAFWIFAGLIAYAGALEALQRYSPGRSSNLEDFAFSAGGVVLGMLLGWALRRSTGRSLP